ncbi:MAG: transporter substrate-binding domain-containing protein [Desulfobacteraceae bacterium]|nr:transporter substrate-binding domain-containing protein [Desulfobacteraceae bacterium]
MKLQKDRLLFFVVFTILLSLTCAPAFAETHANDPQTILVRGDLNYPPFEYLNDDGEPDGFNIEILKAVSRTMNMTVRIDLGPWHLVRKQLENGEIDALAGMYSTEARGEKINFSVPHFISTYSVFVRTDSSITGIGQCSGKTIILQKGDLDHDYVVENNISDKLILEDDWENVIKNLARGKGDCAIVSTLQGTYLLQKSGITNVKPVGEPILQKKYCIAVTKGKDNLLAKFNEGLFIIKTSGEFDAIYEKWFGAFNTEPLTFVDIFIRSLWVIIPLLLLGATGFIWSLVLSNQVRNKTAKLSNELIEHQRTEDKLRKSEEKIKSIFRAAPTGIGLVYDRVIHQVNDKLCEITGLTREELIGQSARLLYPTREEYEYVGREKYSQIQRNGTGTVETKWRHADGRIIDVILSSTPIDMDDYSQGITFSALDITYLKNKEFELSESEKKYQAIMESMKEPVYIGSEDLIIEYMNPTMIKRTGRDATGEKCFKVIHGFEEKCPWCHFEIIKKGDTNEKDIVSARDNRSFHISSTPILHADDSVSMLNVLRDTTEMKKIEVQLQQAQKMEAIGVLAGGIAHDFNNILSGIFGYSKLAEIHMDENPAKAKGHIEQILKGARRATGLVQQILTFSRQTEDEKCLLNISIVVKEALKLLRSSIPATIEIREKVFSKALVMADPTRIHQVVLNLCTNAYHAMRAGGGTLTVELKEIEIHDQDSPPDLNIPAGKYLELKVSDTGKGMDEETLEKAFDPYFTTKEVGEGTGLGLALVYGIVEEHGGHVKVESVVGKGSVFYVYFPVNDEKAPPVDQENDAVETFTGGTERIMVVDDEESILTSTREFLKDYGYKVSAFSKSREAFDAFKEDPSRFDLLITDMTMPQMTGFELSSGILKINRDFPIILCTGYSENFDEQTALENGIRMYIQKPVDIQGLLLVIRKMLDA